MEKRKVFHKKDHLFREIKLAGLKIVQTSIEAHKKCKGSQKGNDDVTMITKTMIMNVVSIDLFSYLLYVVK